MAPKSKEKLLLLTRWAVLALLVLAALCLRVWFVQTTDIEAPLRVDARMYVTYGHNLVQHQVFSRELNPGGPAPDSLVGPGYPLFIALGMLARGASGYYAFVLYGQAVMGALMVWLTVVLGRRFLPWWAALAAGALVAFSPHLIAMGGYFLKETLFGFVLLLGLYLWQRAVDTGRARWFVAAALALGYAWLVNETVFFLPFGLAILALWRPGAWRVWRHPQFQAVALCLALFMVVVAGWKIRNQVSIPPGAPTSEHHAVQVMAFGSYPDFVYKDPALRGFAYNEDPDFQELSGSWGGFFRVMAERFDREPGRYLAWYTYGKPLAFWGWETIQGFKDVYIYKVRQSFFQLSKTANLTRSAMGLLHPLLLFFAFAGSVLALGLWLFGQSSKQREAPLPLAVAGAFLYFTLVYSVFLPLPRYSVPLRPEMYLLALWPAAFLARKSRRSLARLRLPALALAGALAAAVLVLVYADLRGSPSQPLPPVLTDPVQLNHQYHYTKAMFELSKGNVPGAVENLHTVCVIAPNRAGDRARLAGVLMQDRQPGAAFAQLWKARQLAPHLSQVYSATAVHLAETGQYGLAMGYFQKALETNKDDRTAMQGLGQLQAQVKPLIDQAQSQARQKPRDPEAFFQLGVVLRAGREFGRAREAFARALELQPEMARARVQLAGVLTDQGEPEQAAQVLAPLMQAEAPEAEALFETARQEAARGNADQALAWLQRAGSAGFTSPYLFWVDPALAPLWPAPEFQAWMQARGAGLE